MLNNKQQYYCSAAITSKSSSKQAARGSYLSPSSLSKNFYITRDSKTCYEEIELKCRSLILFDRYRLLSRLQSSVVDLDGLQLKLAHNEVSAIKRQQQLEEKKCTSRQLLLALTPNEEVAELDNENLDKQTDQSSKLELKQNANLEIKLNLKEVGEFHDATPTSHITRRGSRRLEEIRKNLYDRFSLDNWRLLNARTLRSTHFHTSSSPTVMISYCRAEARDEARSLKRALEAMNLSVYLDSDEIFPGLDWQDSLNHAVSGCQALIALVSRSYGRTKWTSREFNLADLLGKQIIPVRLDQRWPPAYLGLQLASLQYIEWAQVKSVAALILQSIERHSHEGKFAIQGGSQLMLVAESTNSGGSSWCSSRSGSSSSGIGSENKCLLERSGGKGVSVAEEVSADKQVVEVEVELELELERENDDLEELEKSFESSSSDTEWNITHSHPTRQADHDQQTSVCKETRKRDYLWLRKVSYVFRYFNMSRRSGSRSRSRSCKSGRAAEGGVVSE